MTVTIDNKLNVPVVLGQESEDTIVAALKSLLDHGTKAQVERAEHLLILLNIEKRYW